MIENFLDNSKVATENQQKEYLRKLLGNKKFVTYMLYRGSDHGWTAKDFHDRCDNKGPTISLFKVKDGDVIGGYSKAQWSSDGKHVGDSDAMLFNLSCQRHFPNKGYGREICCHTSWGPYYGAGELAAGSPFNGQGYCRSNAGCSAYGIPKEGGKNALTNQDNGFFTITELEVWSIKEEVRNMII